MNIDIANRLMNLRKEKGYTQEELADALGISRQAVSKWERAEASPDTDNLICLARLYNISLDELLDTKLTSEELKENKENSFEIKDGGIHVLSKEGDEVHIGFDGIHVSEKEGDNVYVGPLGISVNNKKYERFNKVEKYVGAITILLVTIAYFILGFSGYWHPSWILFILAPVPSSIVRMIYKRKFAELNYPFLITAIYLYLGCVYSLWHPYWILFITIPVYYIVVEPIDSLIRNKNFEE